MLAPWYLIVPAAVVLLVAASLTLAGRPAAPLASADAPALATARGRARGIRLGLAALVSGAVVAAVLLAPRPTGQLASLVSSGRSTVVVLDISQSVSDLVYREIARTLQGIVTAAGASGQIGLVLFSDVAQEALPPGSPASALAPFISYFRPKAERGVNAKPVYYRNAGPTEQILTQYPLNPWYGRFSSGTQISTGLRAAREALHRTGLAGRVILLSDLQEAEPDFDRLTRELVAYERDPRLDLRIVALPPATAKEKAVFWQVTGRRDTIVDSLALATGNRGEGEPTRRLSYGFLAAVLGAAVALALAEGLGRPLRWRAR